MRHQKYESKQLNSSWKNMVLKVKDSPLELEKDFKTISVSTDGTY